MIQYEVKLAPRFVTVVNL